MKTLFLIFSALILTTAAYSQSFLGKSQKEIKELASNMYEDVEVVAESATSIKLLCDGEVNEFLLADGVCVRFNSVKSYKCNCLDADLKAYNQNLKSVGAMKWVSNEGDKLYEIELKNKEYMVSISNAEGTLTAMNN